MHVVTCGVPSGAINDRARDIGKVIPRTSAAPGNIAFNLPGGGCYTQFEITRNIQIAQRLTLDRAG